MKRKTIIRISIGVLSTALLFLLVYFFENISGYFFENNNAPRGELIKVVLTFIAGIIAILVWHSGYKRVKVMEKQTEKTAEQIQVMYKGNIDTRFNNAVGHLSSENPTVILGGLHALHQIAVEHKNYTQVVHNLFCNYLRENSAKLYKKNEIEDTPHRCPVIIQTLIDYLFAPYNDKDCIYKEYKSDLSYSTFKNCKFQGISIENINFRHCILENCNFKHCFLNNCNFARGTLKKCDFLQGILTNCVFIYSALNDCNFERGTLTDCSFEDGTLNGCIFFSGTLSYCRFKKVRLKNCGTIDYVKLINTELPPNKVTENYTANKE